MPVMTRDRPTVDARKLGCKCDECPLQDRKPVPPQVRNSRLVLVTDSPDTDADEEGKLLCGRTGRWLNSQLSQIGLKRELLHVTAATLCKPLVKMHNKDWMRAVRACRPRLVNELGTDRVVFAMGEWAYHASGGGSEKFSRWRGTLQTLDGNQVVAYNSVAFSAWYQPWHSENFGRMLYRTAALAAGTDLGWTWPQEHLYPNETALEVLQRLAEGGPIGLDIENKFNGTITAIGVANSHEGVCLPWEPYQVDGQWVKGILDYGEIGAKCRDKMLSLIESEHPKVLQNGNHDALYLYRKGIWLGGFVRDTLLESVVLCHPLPHDLQYLVAMEFPINPWKAEFKDSDLAKSTEDMNDLPEEELRRYCLRDTFATVKLDEVLYARLQALDTRGALQRRLDELHTKALHGMRMRFYGFPVDQKAVLEHLSRDKAAQQQALDQARQLVLDSGYYQYLIKMDKVKNWKKKYGPLTPEALAQHQVFNPGSDDQVARVVYGLFKIPVLHHTDGGEPSTNDKALTYVKEWRNTNPKIGLFADAVLAYRYHTKRITQYWANLEGKSRVHPVWKFHGTVTGRASAGLESPTRRGFSIQTVPKDMRNVFCAEPGSYLLAPDYAAAELRIIACLAGDEALLDAFNTGEDIHLANAKALFNKPDLTKDHPLRQSAKIVFGFNYGIDPRAAWERLRADGVDISEEFVARVHRRWFELHPKITQWQQTTLAAARRDMFIELSDGWRIEFFGDPERDVKVTDTSNYPVQGNLARIVGPAFMDIAREVGWSQKRHLVADVHDELLLCTDKPKEDALLMARHMNKRFTHGSHSVDMVVEFKIGKNWGKYHKHGAKCKASCTALNENGLREVSLEDIVNGTCL